MAGTDLRDPGFRYVIQTKSHGELTLHPRDAKRTVDKRNPAAAAETVWECTVNGVVLRLWPEEIVKFDMQEVR